VDISLVSKSLSLARLPDAVVAAFASPLDIQFRWAQPLAEALQKDPDGVLARAARLRATGERRAASEVLAVLTAAGGQGVLNGSTPSRQVIEGQARAQRGAQPRCAGPAAAGILGRCRARRSRGRSAGLRAAVAGPALSAGQGAGVRANRAGFSAQRRANACCMARWRRPFSART
jgi:hypothetical protein